MIRRLLFALLLAVSLLANSHVGGNLGFLPNTPVVEAAISDKVSPEKRDNAENDDESGDSDSYGNNDQGKGNPNQYEYPGGTDAG